MVRGPSIIPVGTPRFDTQGDHSLGDSLALGLLLLGLLLTVTPQVLLLDLLAFLVRRLLAEQVDIVVVFLLFKR